MTDINLDNPEWTIDYFEKLNKVAEELGCNYLKVIIDRENKMVYKDQLHQIMGIGISVS